MSKKEWHNLSVELQENIKRSINHGDFQNINKDVGSTVNNALEMAFDDVRKALSSIQINDYVNNNSGVKSYKEPNRKDISLKGDKPVFNQATYNKSPYSKPPKTFPYKPVGRVAGTLYSVFGSIGIGSFGTAVIVLMIIEASKAGISALTPIIAGLLVALAGSIVMEMRGSALKSRLKRFRRYLSLLKGRNNCTIKELASYSGANERFVTKDFKKMIDIGMFPQAHIDEENTLIMLNRESYERCRRLQEELDSQLVEDKKVKREHVESHSEELTIVEEGRRYIYQISEANKIIVDNEVSNKIYRMEDIVSRIIDYISAHPEQVSEVRRLMEYYLPTTIKLLNAYREFEIQPVQGENIKTGRREIKEALDSINIAFENLLDNLFESVAWDVSSDISVLQTMLAQEGLAQKDFEVTKSVGGENE